MSAGIWPPHEPPRRTRRDHRKSRNGCQVCKRRRVRCDEGRPICFNCLTRGHDCVYVRPEASAEESERLSLGADSSALVMSPFNFLPTIPIDPFESLDVEMPYNSHELLHHHVSYHKELLNMIIRSSGLRESDLPLQFTPSPAYKRSVMMMAAKHNYGLTGSDAWGDAPAYLHHKAEVIRMIVDQISRNPHNPGDWSFIVVFFLVSMESLNHDTQAAETHLKGLMILLETVQSQSQNLYDAGQGLLKMGLIFFSLLEASKIPSTDSRFLPAMWRNTPSPLMPPHSWTWAGVAYMLSHFILGFPCLKSSNPSSSAHAACLQWLMGAIQLTRTRHEQQQQQQHHGYHDPQEREWILAGTCYALLFIALLKPQDQPEGSLEPGDEAALEGLRALRQWWQDSMRAWVSSKGLPSWALSLEVLDKIALLTSPSGEAILARLLRETNSRHILRPQVS